MAPGYWSLLRCWRAFGDILACFVVCNNWTVGINSRVLLSGKLIWHDLCILSYILVKCIFKNLIKKGFKHVPYILTSYKESQPLKLSSYEPLAAVWLNHINRRAWLHFWGHGCSLWYRIITNIFLQTALIDQPIVLSWKTNSFDQFVSIWSVLKI